MKLLCLHVSCTKQFLLLLTHPVTSFSGSPVTNSTVCLWMSSVNWTWIFFNKLFNFGKTKELQSKIWWVWSNSNSNISWVCSLFEHTFLSYSDLLWISHIISLPIFNSSAVILMPKQLCLLSTATSISFIITRLLGDFQAPSSFCKPIMPFKNISSSHIQAPHTTNYGFWWQFPTISQEIWCLQIAQCFYWAWQFIKIRGNKRPTRSVFLNRQAAARYRVLASIIPGREKPEETTICYKISLVQLITNLNVILYLSTCHTIYISVLILFMIK